MIPIKLYPLDTERIINIDQIVEINRFDELELEDGEKVIDGSLISLANGSEIVLDNAETDSLFAHALEQIDLLNQFKTKLGQP